MRRDAASGRNVDCARPIPEGPLGACSTFSAAARRSAMRERSPTSSTSRPLSWCRRASTNIPAPAPDHYAKVLFREPEFQTAVEAIALARLSARARHGGGDGRGRAASLRRRPAARSSMRSARSCSRSSTAIRSRRRSASRPGARRAPSWRAGSSSSACIAPKRAMDIRGALGGNLFRSDADPREAARTRFPDHAQLSAG